MDYTFSIGEKIKLFRKRASISQFELEMRLGMSPGCLSRIESGKVNPQKETLVKIVDLLKLNDIESAYLFGLRMDAFPKTLGLINEISYIDDVDLVFSKAVNELAEVMGFVICAAFLLKEDCLWGQAYARTKPSVIAMNMVGRPIKDLWITEKKDKGNALLRTALDNKVVQTGDFYNIGRGTVARSIMIAISKLARIDDAVVVPLEIRGKSIGSLLCVKPKTEDYSYELPILKAIATQLAIKYQSINTKQRLPQTSEFQIVNKVRYEQYYHWG